MVFIAEIGDRFDQLSYLGDYHPWKKYGERNPNFNVFSGKILDVKDNREVGIQHFFNILEEIIVPGIAVAVVPSHDPAKLDGGLRTIAQRLVASGRIDATACLVRHTKIEKLATGGDRSIEVHLGSIEVRDSEIFADLDVLVLDDVTTSGNSLAACQRLLLESGASRVQRLAIGKTV